MRSRTKSRLPATQNRLPRVPNSHRAPDPPLCIGVGGVRVGTVFKLSKPSPENGILLSMKIEWAPIEIRFQLSQEALDKMEEISLRDDLSRGSIVRRALARRMRVLNIQDWPRKQDTQLDEKYPQRLDRKPFTKRGIKWSPRRIRVAIPVEWHETLETHAANTDTTIGRYVRDSLHDYLGIERLPDDVGLEQEPFKSKPTPWQIAQWNAKRKKQ